MKTTGETINEMMAKILEYQNDDGFNCLFACYEMLAAYENKGNDSSTTPMKMEIEATIKLLLEMGRDNGIDMARVINHVAKSGQTLLHRSARHSEEVALLLIQMNVKVNEIDAMFQTVSFEVNSILIWSFEYNY